MVRVLVADDHPIVRRGLVFFLNTQPGIEVIGEAGDGKEAVMLSEQLNPDVILMDVLMPGMNGIEATETILSRQPNMKILMLTSSSDQNHILPALEAGAMGYQLKDIEPDALAASIRNLLAGQKQLHQEATNRIIANISGDRSKTARMIETLTKREMEVLKEVAKGKSNREIASSLFITEKTVKTHITHIFSKLDLSDRTQAALFAVKNGLTS